MYYVTILLDMNVLCFLFGLKLVQWYALFSDSTCNKMYYHLNHMHVLSSFESLNHTTSLDVELLYLIIKQWVYFSNLVYYPKIVQWKSENTQIV